MGQKKRQKKKRVSKPTAKSGDTKQHPQKNFLKMVEEASLKMVKPFVQEQVQQLGFALQQEQAQTLASIGNRLVVLETIVTEKLGFTMGELCDRVADLEDEQTGYEKVEVIEEGDLVRLEVATKTVDQEEFQGTSKLILTGCGVEPLTIGPELEPKLVGLKTGEQVELAFGKDDKMLAKVIIERVSRKIVEKLPAEGDPDEDQNAD